MTHREFLVWLKPQLEGAVASGLPRDLVRAIRETLERMRAAGPLQPFASRLLSLVHRDAPLDAKAVAALVAQVRVELAPPRERTVVLSEAPDDEEPRGGR